MSLNPLSKLLLAGTLIKYAETPSPAVIEAAKEIPAAGGKDIADAIAASTKEQDAIAHAQVQAAQGEKVHVPQNTDLKGNPVVDTSNDMSKQQSLNPTTKLALAGVLIKQASPFTPREPAYMPKRQIIPEGFNETNRMGHSYAPIKQWDHEMADSARQDYSADHPSTAPDGSPIPAGAISHLMNYSARGMDRGRYNANPITAQSERAKQITVTPMTSADVPAPLAPAHKALTEGLAGSGVDVQGFRVKSQSLNPMTKLALASVLIKVGGDPRFGATTPDAAAPSRTGTKFDVKQPAAAAPQSPIAAVPKPSPTPPAPSVTSVGSWTTGPNGEKQHGPRKTPISTGIVSTENIKPASLSPMTKLALAGKVMLHSRPEVFAKMSANWLGRGAQIVAKQIPKIMGGMRAALPGASGLYPEAVEAAGGGWSSLSGVGKQIMQGGRAAQTAAKGSEPRMLQADLLRKFRTQSWTPMSGTYSKFGPQGQLLNPETLAAETASAPLRTPQAIGKSISSAIGGETAPAASTVGTAAKAAPAVEGAAAKATSYLGGAEAAGLDAMEGAVKTPQPWLQQQFPNVYKGVQSVYRPVADAVNKGRGAVGDFALAHGGKELMDHFHQLPGWAQTVGRQVANPLSLTSMAGINPLGALPGPVGQAYSIFPNVGRAQGAEEAKQQILTKGPQMMQQVLSQMPVMMRLQYLANPEAFNKYLTPELLQQLMARAQTQR